MASDAQWGAWLHLDDEWEGITRQPVIVVGETQKRYRICSISPEPVRLAGGRLLGPDTTALVPKYTVTRRNGDA